MRGRVFFCALTGAIALLPMQSIAQDVSVASAAAVVLPKMPAPTGTETEAAGGALAAPPLPAAGRSGVLLREPDGRE